MYINDLCNGQLKLKLTSFGDDTAVCYVDDICQGLMMTLPVIWKHCVGGLLQMLCF